MQDQLNQTHLLKARTAILDRIRDLNLAPDGMANIHMFQDERTEYASGYFQAAFLQLVEEELLELHAPFLRLLPAGYELINQM